MNPELKPLIGKLNPQCHLAMKAATDLCRSRSNYNVEIEHLLDRLCSQTDNDINSIFRQYELNSSRITADLSRALDRLKTGNGGGPALSPRLVKLLADSWTIGSLEYGAARVRSGLILLTLLGDESLTGLVESISPELRKVSLESLRKHLLSISAGSVENTGASAEPAQATSPAVALSATPSLDQYTVDLTAAARQGKIDPVLGRDFEIRQIVDILTRRRQNNPILTGEAGVGKTAVVEGFALRVVAGDVPPPLLKVSVRTLDLALLQAGAGIKGEFENRLKSVMAEVKESRSPIILFIDEAHTIIGAGGQAGQGDAANLLKPALARGELRTIAATTWSEYKKYFEKDAALARRFQVVKVEEPAEAQALNMMRGLAEKLESHHGVRILDEAVDASVRLSHRYITGRQLPDKSVSVLDTACARVAIGHSATPPLIEDCIRNIAELETEARRLKRESASTGDHEERLGEVEAERESALACLASMRERHQHELALLSKIVALRTRAEESVTSLAQPLALSAGMASSGAAAAFLPSEDIDVLRIELTAANAELAALQGEKPLLRVSVDAQAIADVISGWTGIPVGKMIKDEVQTVLRLQHLLGERVVGQPHALEAIAQRVRTARAGLDDPARPVGVFLLVGPSGVGKTETAMALADILYGGESNAIVINMSEYQEAHSVSGLKGSPPGYVGYGEGGVLTEAVRRKPYSVVLLDEMEKAHVDVMELFYQVFDKGMMEDGEGREIDFRNTIILMTSNAASERMMALCADPETIPAPEALAETIAPDLRKIFKPALLGRLVVVPYYPLTADVMARIIELKLGKVRQRLLTNHGTRFEWTPALVNAVARHCTDAQSGAREIDRVLTSSVLPKIADMFLERLAVAKSLRGLRADGNSTGEFTVQEF